jgi:hypothetical protein
MVQLQNQKYMRIYIYIIYLFIFLSFFNTYTWLNWLMDDCHLNYITKLNKKALLSMAFVPGPIFKE